MHDFSNILSYVKQPSSIEDKNYAPHLSIIQKL